MKVREKKIICFNMILVTMALLAVFIQMPLKAKAATGSVPVTYTVEQSAEYGVILTVKGDGCVYDGQEDVRDGKKSYMLPIDETMLFEIKADNGAIVKSVTLNGKVLSKDDDRLLIKGMEKIQTINVEFVEKSDNQVKTSDNVKLEVCVTLFVIAIIGLLYFYQRNRKRRKK